MRIAIVRLWYAESVVSGGECKRLLSTLPEAVLLIHHVTHVPPQCASLILFTPYVGGTYLSGKLYGKGVTCIIS